MLRKPAVSGIFYPDNKRDLEDSIKESFLSPLGTGEVPVLKCDNYQGEYPFNIFVPHAGFQYSAPAASFGYSKIVEEGFPETFIILSPNHTGFGEEISVFNEGEWITPLGNVHVDAEFADAIIENSDTASSDYFAHLREHSIEVQLPILQFFSNNFKIVPITIGLQSPENAVDLAKSIVESASKLGKSYCVIASTDFSHFNNQSLANELDGLLLEDIRQMDEEKLFEDVYSFDISMCGYGVVATTILVSKLTGKNQSEVFTYYTSGDVSHDFSKVVGYASGIFK